MSLTRSPQHSVWTSATSGDHARICSSAASGVETSDTSWPAAHRTRASLRRFGVRAWASNTRIPVLDTRRPSSEPRMNVHRSDQLANVRDVAVHLLDQRLDGLEALLAADALDEVQPQLLAVQVALEGRDERLDQQATAGDERRAHADGDGCRPLPHARHRRAAGVDAVVGYRVRGVR